VSSEYDLDAGPDPADLAAARPERRDSDNPVYAVGIGPGNTDYITEKGADAIREADVVVGFETVVGFVSGLIEGETLTCGYRDEAETLSTFAERIEAGKSGTAVLMGDPNHSGYQFVGKVEQAVDRPVSIIPGISSLQIAASRARTPMEETVFVTLHKSGDIDPDIQRLREHVGKRNLLVLPRPFDRMPGDIAAELLTAGAEESLTALVYERLTHDEESTTRTTLGELADHAGGSDPDDTPFSDLSILVVRSG